MTRRSSWIAGLLVVLSVLSGCRSVCCVPVEHVRTDTAYVSQTSRDSIYVRDSVVVREAGDTVRITKWRYVYKDRIVRDTVFRQLVDSIPEIVAVEREPTRWEKTKQEAGGVAIGLIGAAIIAGVVWLIVKMRKKLH